MAFLTEVFDDPNYIEDNGQEELISIIQDSGIFHEEKSVKHNFQTMSNAKLRNILTNRRLQIKKAKPHHALMPAAPERALFTQSLPDLAVWTPPTAQSRTGPRRSTDAHSIP